MIYRVWNSMMQRCYNPNQDSFESHGARGIKVCEQWRTNPAQFAADMGERPLGMTLERKDNDKDYSPDNCRWATRKEQANNKRTNVRLTFMGETLTVPQWAERLGIKPYVIHGRILCGWTGDRILTAPIRTWPSRSKHQ